MTATPTTGNAPARQRNWAGYLRVIFWVAYLYVPWHYGVFFGQRVQCIYFPRDWILHAFAVFGYIALAAILVVFRWQPAAARAGSIAFSTGMAGIGILGLLTLQFFEQCL